MKTLALILKLGACGALLAAGLALSAVELGAGWLNQHCQDWFKEIYEA